jgi:hypothetical protein
VSRIDDYRAALRAREEWDAFLLRESGLPGPRGNLELAQAVAEEGDEARFRRYLALDARQAPANSQAEFLAFCGVLGLGHLLAEAPAGGERSRELLDRLREAAVDPRWRAREAVAMALQRWGDIDMDALLAEMERWCRGSPLEQRAAAAALCEPRLLRDEGPVRRVLGILNAITESMVMAEDRRSEAFRALRKGMGYCWSVAVAALPGPGTAAMERWLGSSDPDVRWVMRENLKKARLARMDAAWVAAARERVGGRKG